MDDFSKAIIYSFDPNIAAPIKEQAIKYCDTVRSTPDAWRFCLEQFHKSNLIQVKFFCLQVLQDLVLHGYATISDPDKLFLKSTLMTWVRDVLPTVNEDLAIKNKFAQVLVLLFKSEYPEHWPTFFQDFLALLPRGTAILELFLRILKTTDEEVVSLEVSRSPAELARNVLIKDYMREHAVGDLVKMWAEILREHHRTSAAVVNLCLQNIKAFIVWIDIGLIVNDKVMPPLLALLSIIQYRESVCDCLHEIVNKGMDPILKFGLLKQLKLNLLVNAAATDDEAFLIKLGRLINTTGVELIGCWEAIYLLPPAQGAPLVPEAEAMLLEMLNMLFKFMSSELVPVASSVMTFGALYINKLKLRPKQTPQQIEHLQLMLQIMRLRMKYPTTFDFDEEDEPETEFNDYRKELANLFRNIFRIIPDATCSFVHSTIVAVNVSPPPPFPDAEMALYIFYQLGECVAGSPEETVKSTEAFFSQMMAVLSTSSMSVHPHHAVTLTFLETAHRYARYIPTNHLVPIIAAFMDHRGIRHPRPAMRQRACYLFRQFVKVLKSQLCPYLDNILESLKDLLVISFEVQKSVPFDDQASFFESLALLIGQNPNVQQQQKHIETLLQPIINQIEDILTKERFKTDTPDKPFYSTLLKQLVTIVATFSKGFATISVKEPSPSSAPSNPSSPVGSPAATPPVSPSRANLIYPSRAYFAKALDSVMRIPRLLPGDEELRDKVFFFMHRMVEVMGTLLLPYLPTVFPLLMANSLRIKDIIDFVTLVNQITSRFKDAVTQVIHDMLLPIISHLFKFLNPTVAPTPNSEEQREVLDLQRHYYLLIQGILNNNIGSILTSSVNAPNLQQILATVIEGCSPTYDMSIQKLCVGVLRRMVEEWGGSNITGGAALPGFNKFIYEQIVPRLFSVSFARASDLGDSGTHAFVMEIAKLLKSITTKCGAEFLTFLGQVYLPSLNVPADLNQQFLVHLEKDAIKQFSEFYKQFIRFKR